MPGLSQSTQIFRKTRVIRKNVLDKNYTTCRGIYNSILSRSFNLAVTLKPAVKMIL